MSEKDPRDWSHQQRGVKMARDAMTGPDAAKSIVAVMATGGGKSRWAGMIIKSHLELAVERGRRAQAIFIVNRRNLVTQMSDTLAGQFGIEPGIIMDGFRYKAGEACYCASIDTLAPRLRDGSLNGTAIFSRPLDPTLIVVDEAHHAVTKQYLGVFASFPNAYRILQTATPERQDGRGLGDVAQRIIDIADYKYLQEKGILAKIRYFTAPPEDLEVLEGKKKRGREVSDNDQAEVFCRPKIVGDVVQTWLRCAEGRKTIVFCVNVAHAVAEADEFERGGVKAAILHAKSSDAQRDAVFLAMEKGEITVICNVGLYVEGMDAPDVWCVQVARRVGGLGTWRQMVGRGARVPWPSKHQDLIVIDHGGNLDRHGPVDLEMEWSLSPDQPAAKRKKLEAKESKGCRCKVCGCEFNAPRCPDCGTELRKAAKKVDALDAELIEVTDVLPSKVDWVEKRMIFAALKWQALSRGWKEGWAWFMYEEIFGIRPYDKRVNSALPIYPEPGSMADRYLKIAMIKHKNRRRNHVSR
jgi:DNA repair protein RadD